jgi:hypothetical protein
MKRRPVIDHAAARPARHRSLSGAPSLPGGRHLTSAAGSDRRIERRRNRSSNLGQALHLQLEACRAEGALEAIVVADDLGLCVAASSGTPARLDELAAWLPLSERAGLDVVRGPAVLGLSATTALRRFVVGGSALFVCAVGGQTDTRAASLLRAETGFRRILADG